MAVDPESGTTFLSPGDRARIVCAQFEGWEVQVVSVDQPGRTVHVSMTVFGRPVPLEFSFEEAASLLRNRGTF